MWYTQGSQYLLLSDLRRDCSPGRIKKLKRTKTGINQIKHNHLIPIDEKSRKMFYHPIIPIIHEHNCYFHDIYSMPELRNQSHTQVHHPHMSRPHESHPHKTILTHALNCRRLFDTNRYILISVLFHLPILLCVFIIQFCQHYICK